MQAMPVPTDLVSLFRVRAAALLAVTLALATPAPGQERALAFVENAGQQPAAVAFAARRGPMHAWFTAGGFTLALERDAETVPPTENGFPARSLRRDGVVLRHCFPSAAAPEAGEPRPGRVHYLKGTEAARHARTFGKLRYRDAAPGVDVTVRDDPQGLLAYDLEVEPGASLDAFEMRIEGASALEVEASGSLVVSTAIGPVRHSRPIAWQLDARGQRIQVPLTFRLTGPDRYGFAAARHDPSKTLFVDPTVTYHGGSANDLIYAIEYDRDGTLVVAGESWSTDFPTTTGAFQRTLQGTMDVVLSRFDLRRSAASQLVFSTYLGGTGDELAFDLELRAGMIFLGGITTSTDFPQAGNTKPGGVDGFVARLDGAGTTVQMSRYVGGSAEDWVCSIVVDSALRTVAGGYTRSSNLSANGQITGNAFQAGYQGNDDGFVQRVTLSGGVDYGSYLGGPAVEGTWFVAWAQGAMELRKLGVELHPSGDIVVAGITTGAQGGFPTTANAWSPVRLGTSDMFASQLRIDQASTTLVYSTYFGGGPGPQTWDIPFAMDVGLDGTIVLAGCTWVAGTDFPTTPGAIQTTLAGRNDHCLSVLDPTRTGSAQLVYSTLLGSTELEAITGVRVDERGFLSFAGFAWGALPTTPGALQPTLNGPVDAHVGRVRPGTSGIADLIYSSYFGGSRQDWGGNLALGPDGQMAMVGVTDSPDLPKARGTLMGGFDGYLAELEMLPSGVTRLGTTSGHCLGGVIFEPDRQPAASQPLVLLTGNAPRGAPGLMLLGLPLPASVPLPGLGVELQVGLAPAIVLSAVADARGTSALALRPLPVVPLGIAVQGFWLETGTCPGQRPLAASAGLGF